MKNRRISNFEDRLERLIEGSFMRLFRGPLQPREVALQLARAIEDNTIIGGSGREAAPTYYQIRLFPDDQAVLLAQTPDIAGQLAQEVINYCQETGLHLLSTPVVILTADPEVAAHGLRIEARHIVHKHETTQMMEPVGLPLPSAKPEAQLVIDGQRTVPINRDVFNIGRHPDNNLVINDVRVSRHHLQIRLSQGHYVLYDTRSRGGTYVNGQRVNEYVLSSGDVIRIGGASLLYLEEDIQDRSLADTQRDLVPPSIPEG
jgi:hypothetical protein